MDLRHQQVAILRALAKFSQPIPRKKIAAVSEVNPSKIGDFAGPRPEDQSEETKARWNFPTLVELELVKVGVYDERGRDVMMYSITRKGRELLKGMKDDPATRND